MFCAFETKSGEKGNDTPTKKCPCSFQHMSVPRKRTAGGGDIFAEIVDHKITSLHDDLRFQTSLSICGQVS